MKSPSKNFATSKSAISQVLDWYYNDSPAVMGLKSNFGSFLSCLELGTNPAKTPIYVDPEDSWTEERLQQIRRHKIVRQSLGHCSLATQKILEQYYTYRQWPPQLRAYFDDLTGVAIMSVGLDKLFTWVLNQKDHKKSAKNLKSQCRRVLEAATAEFTNNFRQIKEQYE